MEFDFVTILNWVLGILAVVGGGLYLNAKGKLKQGANVMKEGYDVVKATVDALDDDKIDNAEKEKIKNEAAEFKAAVRILLGK